MSDSYGETYIAWKQWGEGFGELQRGDADYFRRELQIAERLRPIRRVLEIGFGNGAFLGYARQRGWEVVGLELQEELVALAQEHGFEAYRSDGQEALDAQEFDAIVAFDVLEHIPADEAVEFLDSLRARLSPGGAIVLRYPNADTWMGNVFFTGDPTHVNEIGYFKMQYLAGRAGLRIVSHREPRRRGFSTSIVHGLHRMTGGVIARAAGTLRRMIYFPDIPALVLSHVNVVTTLAADR